MCVCVCVCVCVCSNQNCELVKFNGRLREEVKLARAGAKHARLLKKMTKGCMHVFELRKLARQGAGINVCTCICLYHV